ncbi:hypothetical protein HAX54_049987, partial [Datura stramonium]|nr:hypothetical protein [Datura stramonium]
EEDASSLPNNMDDEELKAGEEEENLKEMFEGNLLNSEGLEEDEAQARVQVFKPLPSTHASRVETREML